MIVTVTTTLCKWCTLARWFPTNVARLWAMSHGWILHLDLFWKELYLWAFALEWFHGLAGFKQFVRTFVFSSILAVPRVKYALQASLPSFVFNFSLLPPFSCAHPWSLAFLSLLPPPLLSLLLLSIQLSLPFLSPWLFQPLLLSVTH